MKKWIFRYNVIDRCQKVDQVSGLLGSTIKEKCPICRKDQKWRIAISKTGKIFRRKDFNDGIFVDIIKLDCFGAKPIGFTFGNCWKITAENDQVFEDVDISEQWIHNFNGHAAVVKKLTTIFTENQAAS
ncbi:uncharacterized protein LOC133868155 [Alnus glutinosa]|uniref:uncharacterized protein LOC133868155 n=1 Tax=Alnus glutinosa TaxID=3517 RepID=UPI002D78E3C9|nr:uncharacterized protein LOC133868155 [Alnus glutinosa]